jgi:hypothetical protein
MCLPWVHIVNMTSGVRDIGGQPIRIKGAPRIVMNVVVAVWTVDEPCGIESEESSRAAITVAEAVVDEVAGFFPFAVGSVVA